MICGKKYYGGYAVSGLREKLSLTCTKNRGHKGKHGLI